MHEVSLQEEISQLPDQKQIGSILDLQKSSLLEYDSKEGHLLKEKIAESTQLPEVLSILITNYLKPLTQQEVDARLAAADEVREKLRKSKLTPEEKKKYYSIIKQELDFSNTNLSGLNFSKCNGLYGASFTNASLYNTNFTRANLKGIPFIKTYFDQANCRNAIMNNEQRKLYRALTQIFKRRNSHRAWGDRGWALSRLERHDEALEAVNQAIALKPEEASYHNNKGISLAELNRHDEALEAYNQAIALEPKKADYHDNKGSSLAELNRYDEALETFNQAIALKPEEALYHYHKGRLLDELNLHDEALEAYNQAIALKPEKALYHYHKGLSLAELNRHDEALEAYNQVIALEPKDDDITIVKAFMIN